MNKFTNGRKILLGITGGIAAYKIPFLVRLLKKSNCELEIIMTPSAENFVTPMTLATLANKRVWRENDFIAEGHNIPHIKLSEWADVIAIAPCSANTLAKISHGIADNLLTSTILAASCPIIIFPAMNQKMFMNPATQVNIKILSERGINIIEPASGDLACGESGRGRMPEPQEIFYELQKVLCGVNDMSGKKVLITAGPTHEYLDPVRYISNPSTGKMGVAMARAAWLRGADVKLIAGPADIDSYGFEVIRVSSAQEMLNAVMKNLEWADFIVKAAAVGDYRAKNFNAQKIKREGKDSLIIELVQNPDIAAEVGRLKCENQILIGFAAETENILTHAREKLSRKNLDYILANDVTGKDSGFASDSNIIRVIPRDETKDEKIFTGLKQEIAFEIWDYVLSN
ncbi:MAG: bifunctional phosphopantothenoylcysteine decarboxylase/phosphopantothenate--cysteine ligase CoaBC [Synergistaceae bacterium]|nr:bifunctional phosphopantothenoylcysteine decarboxylase/phosphopantothenate--cysteine ligase CoaBC [Synergistaceae bacterium]